MDLLVKMLLLLLLITGCSTQNKALRQERKTWGYKHWKEDFKDWALCNCLLEGNNPEVKHFILENDKSYYDAIGIAVFDPVLQPVIKQEVAKIKADSIRSLTTVGEAAQGKTVFTHCMNFYRSTRLDSLAKAQHHAWKNIKHIEELVLEKIPSY